MAVSSRHCCRRVLRRCGRRGLHRALHLARVQRLLNPIVGVELFDVFHLVDQSFFADLPLVCRHNRRITRCRVYGRVQNRVAQEGVIHPRIRSVRQLHLRHVSRSPVRAARRGVARVDSIASRAGTLPFDENRLRSSVAQRKSMDIGGVTFAMACGFSQTLRVLLPLRFWRWFLAHIQTIHGLSRSGRPTSQFPIAPI